MLHVKNTSASQHLEVKVEMEREKRRRGKSKCYTFSSFSVNVMHINKCEIISLWCNSWLLQCWSSNMSLHFFFTFDGNLYFLRVIIFVIAGWGGGYFIFYFFTTLFLKGKFAHFCIVYSLLAIFFSCAMEWFQRQIFSPVLVVILQGKWE